MATQEAEVYSSVGKPDAEGVANMFLHQYYFILHQRPFELHKFYNDQSVMKWPGVELATTMDGIHKRIMSSDYQGCQVKIIDFEAQESLMEGFIVAVTGCLLGNDNVKKIISQTFFLAKQEKGYFVLNDNLQIIDTHEILNHSFDCGVDESASIGESEPTGITAQPEPVKELMEIEAKENGEKTPEASDNGEKTPEASDSGEKTPEVTVTAAEVPKKPVITVTQNLSPPAAANEKLDVQKTSYASVLAKEGKVAFPTDNSGHKIVRVAPSSNQQSVTSPASNAGYVTKERIASSHGSTENNRHIHDKSSNDFHLDDAILRSVYIQNLPSDITKNELAEAVKIFGQVRPADIQIRTFEDGFCFGFVEFESVTSAKNAVEAHNITVKDHEARISFKKSNRAGNGGARNGGGFRPRNFRGQEKGGEMRSNGGGVYNRDDNRGDFTGQARSYAGQNREFGQRNNNNQSRDGYHPRNNWRSDERWSNGGQRRNGQLQNEVANADS